MNASITYQDPDPNPHPPHVKSPAGACDCHAHIFGPEDQYPVIPGARFRNPRALHEDYEQVLAVLGMTHAVLVQPHVYGSDNRCLWNSLKRAAGAWRGIAVVSPAIRDDELYAMHQAGFRGVRFNLRNAEGLRFNDLAEIAARIRPLGWHIEFAADASELPAIAAHSRHLGVDIVIPHMGRVPAGTGVSAPEFQALLGLLQEGRCWVKLSAGHRMSGEPFPHDDLVPFVESLLATASHRLTWASDWPHTSLSSSEYMPNDGDLLDLFCRWVPDQDFRRRILVENPAALYGFSPLQSKKE